MLDLYDRHHADLTAAVDCIIRRSGRGLLIDCHSFASRQLVYENPGENPDLRERERPDICIGTDPAWHTPAWLQDSLVKSFSGRRYTVVLNDPFSGTLVPMKYYQDGRLLSVMIEVNRKLYMDEETGEKTAGFETVRRDITDAISELLDVSEGDELETRLIVCGGVDFNDYVFFKSQMDRLITYYENIKLI